MISFNNFILDEDLRQWFKDRWVRMDTKGNIKGDCAREPGEGKPKCLPIAKARAMDKEDRATAARRKRREDPVADRSGKGGAPINVQTEEYIEEKNAPTNPALWSRAKSLARQKFDVYPSAYANGWAAKWYKGKGGGWKSISESVDILSLWKNQDPVSYTKHLTKFFGKPDELTENRAVWYNVDGFKRIEILDEYIMHASPSPHYDYVYCYIDLKVPHILSNILADSSESILLDHLKGEVGARCASLSANAVTIQYVMDVVEGNVKPSKKEYESRIKSMMQMFKDGKRYQLDWWPDTTKDTDPSNTYYEHVDHHCCSINEKITFNELSQKVLHSFTKKMIANHPDTLHTSKLIGKDVKRRRALDLALDKLNPKSAIYKPKVIATTKEDLEEDDVLATNNLNNVKIKLKKKEL